MRRYIRAAIAVLPIVFLGSVNADLPPIPPLPSSSWPAIEPAEAFARQLLVRLSAKELARTLHDQPDLIPGVLRNLGSALLSDDPTLRRSLDAYMVEIVRETSKLTGDVQLLASIVAVDPLRYLNDPVFRQRMDALFPWMIGPLPQASAILDGLTASANLDFDTAEAIASAAHLARRTSKGRRIPFDRDIKMPDDNSGPIEASFYSLNSTFFTHDEVERFLESVHKASPDRKIIVIADAAMSKNLDANITVIPDRSRAFTPWPRDPFIVARRSNGSVVFVDRPNVQPDREEDQNMVRAVLQELPSTMDRAWKKPVWTVAPLPFHNGNILLTSKAVWISIYTVETRVLSNLGLDRVPVETFNDPVMAERYVGSVRQAADELGQLFHRPVRFVHPLSGLLRLSGGAGIDLDSIATILPPRTALVGDLRLGAAEATKDLSALGRVYGISDPKQVIDARAEKLQQFLDIVADELARDGMTVRRLPLLNVPASLAGTPSDFLITWNNVVLEKRGKLRRAEGFASLLPSADAYARKVFETSGYKLDYFPPLVRSIMLGGGYRCASNHLRP
jgi:hypothetical protein